MSGTGSDVTICLFLTDNSSQFGVFVFLRNISKIPLKERLVIWPVIFQEVQQKQCIYLNITAKVNMFCCTYWLSHTGVRSIYFYVRLAQQIILVH